MEKNDEEKKIVNQKMETKIIFNKAKFSNYFNKKYIYVFLLLNYIIASISVNDIKITISGLGNIRIMDLNGREPYCYCIDGSECNGSQFNQENNILYFNNKNNNNNNVLKVKFNIKLSNLKGLFKNCKDITSIDFQDFDFSEVNDANEMFQNCTSLTTINFGPINANNVIKMSYMFSNCSSLSNIDLAIFKNSLVNDMSYIFQNCSSLTEIKLLDFKTSNVGKMDGMFELCSNLINLEQNFDTSKVLSMEKMFCNCKNLVSLDISNFDILSVTNMNSMFKGCKKLNSLKLFNKKTFSLINMGSMFQSCSSLESIDLSNFETSSVQFMNDLFHDCTSLISPTKFEFNTEKVIKMESMFENCKKLTKLDLSSFYTPSLRQIYSMFSGCSSITTIDISNFDTFQITNFANLFADCKSLTEINLNNFVTKMVINMTQMFCNCSSLTNIDISNFNTQLVIDMSSMFKGCSSLEEINLNNLENPNVENMSNMFSGCKKLNSLLTNNFRTSNVKYMNGMFRDCLGFTNLNLYFLDTQNVIDMNSMFSGCSNLVLIDITGFITSNVLNIGSMFSDCTSLTSIDLSNFESSQVTNMDSMFLNCKNIKSFSLDAFNTSNVQSMKSLFKGCSSLEILNLSNFKTGNILYMDSIFNGCNSLIKLDLNNLTLNKVKSMGYMFYECKSLTSLILPNFRRLSVTNTSHMFAGCSSLEEIDLSYFGSSSIEYMDYMFADCSYLKKINLDNWNTRRVKTMDYLFSGCSLLPYIDISSFNTPQLRTIRGMFYSCSSLKNIDLSTLNTSIVSNMDYMFYKATSISTINFYKEIDSNIITYFNTKSVENMKYMFAYCESLEYLDLSFWNTSNVYDMSFMFQNCTTIASLNLSNFELNKVITMENMFYGCLNIVYINLNISDDSGVENLIKIFYDTPLNMIFCINQAEKIRKEIIDTKENCYVFNCSQDYLSSRKKLIIDPQNNINYKCIELCKDIEGSTYYDYSFSCYENCPNGTFEYKSEENDNTCLEEPIRNCSIQELFLGLRNCSMLNEYNDTKEDKNKLINDIVKEIHDFDIIIPMALKEVFTYSLYDEIYHFVAFSNRKKIDNISFIDFQDCENELKKYQDSKNINDELILFKIEYINDQFKIPIIEYKVFNQSGDELDIRVCNHINFIYSTPVEINESEEYKYNPESDYYNELCLQYTTYNLTDITIYGRRKIFNDDNLSLCESNCKYLRYINGRAECECPLNIGFNRYLHLNEELKDNLIFRFKNNHMETNNFGVLKCFKMIFIKESFKSNYANILFISMMLLNIASTIIFWVKEYKSLYSQATLLSKTIEKKPIQKMNKNVNIVKNSKLITTGNNPPPKIKNYINPKKSNFPVKNIDNNIKINSKKSSIIYSKVKSQNSLIDSNFDLKFGLDNLNNNTKMEEEIDQTLLKTEMEINMLSYSEAIKQDKRSCFDIYFSFLKTRHILISIFTRDYNAVLYKISFFFFVFGTCIGINTMFFDDKLIQKIFEAKGEYSCQNHISTQIASIIISGTVASTIKSIVAYLTFTDFVILSIKERNNIPQEEKIDKTLMKVSSKNTTFFIINFIISGFFWIYSSSFSAVFKNTQIFLFVSSSISLVIVIFLPFLYYIIPSLFRVMALNGKNNSYLYRFSQFIELI